MTASAPHKVLPASTEKASFVRQMFNRIAPTYDLLNDCISFGMHRQWKQKACEKLQLQPGDAVLDVCTGTGDLTKILSTQVGPTGQVIGLDFSEEMLAIARKRFPLSTHVEFIQGDALALPFEENSFNGAIVSFGLRNVANLPQAIAEMVRVVKPGGWIVNLDTSPQNNLPGYWFYFSKVMPRVGQLLSMDPTAYQYLSESSKQFALPEALKSLFQESGLSQVEVTPLALGAVSIQSGRKP